MIKLFIFLNIYYLKLIQYTKICLDLANLITNYCYYCLYITIIVIKN